MRNLAMILIAAGVTPLLAQPSPTYRITHTYLLGGDGSWDYVVPDPPNHRLFIARQTRVMVVDEDNGTLLGEVTGIQGAHGTAVAESTGHGFATSGNDQSVVMFDLKTYKALARIPAAEDADAIVYDSVSNRVFTLNGDAHSSTVIDPRDGKVIANLPLGGKPEYGASAGDGRVYANITDNAEVVEIDAKTATVSRRDEGFQLLRPAVSGLRRELQHTVIAPAAFAGKIGDRHELDGGDPQLDQVIELLFRAGEGSLRAEGPYVQLVNHRLVPGPPAPGVVVPFKGGRVDDLTGSMNVVGIAP